MVAKFVSVEKDLRFFISSSCMIELFLVPPSLQTNVYRILVVESVNLSKGSKYPSSTQLIRRQTWSRHQPSCYVLI
jgi:hypothetical protein